MPPRCRASHASRAGEGADGRLLPTDPAPTPNGYSIGRWEGDTLVVRFRRVDFGHLTIELTIDDPKAYTKPWTVTLTQNLVVDSELLDYHCSDNERDAARLTSAPR